MSSLCDKCYSPGACCKNINLTETKNGKEELVVFWDEMIALNVKTYMDKNKYPFVIARKVMTWTVQDEYDEDFGKSYSSYTYNCNNLGKDGRCMDYENRPDLCRRFEPASDGLCVHYKGAEGIDLREPHHYD